MQRKMMTVLAPVEAQNQEVISDLLTKRRNSVLQNIEHEEDHIDSFIRGMDQVSVRSWWVKTLGSFVLYPVYMGVINASLLGAGVFFLWDKVDRTIASLKKGECPQDCIKEGENQTDIKGFTELKLYIKKKN